MLRQQQPVAREILDGELGALGQVRRGARDIRHGISSCGAAPKAEPRSAIAAQRADALVQRRPFGATGVKVSKLTLGGASVMRTDSQRLLDEALRHGIDSWEFTTFTGHAFGGYFKTHPGTRARVFLSGKTKSTNPSVMQEELDAALGENGTSVFDFFAVHGVENAEVLTDEVRAWAEKAKRDGKIRFFGFCTHKNVDRCLDRGAPVSAEDANRGASTGSRPGAMTPPRASR